MNPLSNPNLRPRPFSTWLAGKIVAPFLGLLRVRRDLPPVVFQSYFVGDLFMALPAIKGLAAEIPTLQVLCRPDCVQILRNEGLNPISFENSFCMRPGRQSFLATVRAAWSLRGRIGPALDLDADSRTGLWLRLAGSKRVASFQRPRAVLFDTLYPLPHMAVHQVDKNVAVADAFLRDLTNGRSGVSLPLPELRPAPEGAWLISCWTRLDTKNWPLDRWEVFLERLLALGVSFRVLDPPDGDEGFRAFKDRWAGRVQFLRAPLTEISRVIQDATGVIGTDNFFGHMAAYYGKPVLWINGSSDPRHVVPRGPQTSLVQVEPMPCRPCIHRCVNPVYKECLRSLEVEAVWRAFEDLRSAN
jgi:ADP-heptose:LPS heptosyltransferase